MITNFYIFYFIIKLFIYFVGIKGKSVLFELLSFNFPRSFPIDIMHLFFENVVLHMFKLWAGQFFKDDQNISIPFILSKSLWEEIGIIMQNNRKNMPLDFGRPPRNIFKHNAGYKAEEWANWITLYSVPLLKSKLPDRYKIIFIINIFNYLLNLNF